MNFQEFLKKYPDAQLAVSLVDEGVEYYHVKDKDYIIEFLTKPDNRVGEYEEEGVEAKSIRIVRPNAKIDRITMN
jgi:DNA-dependent RNA polymerase auxiliary subunit epsilon